MNETRLSERETEILKLVATGLSNKEISQELLISVNTVKVHLRNIFSKLAVASRTEAAMWAVQNGVVATGMGRESTPDTVELHRESVHIEPAPQFWYAGVPKRLRISLIAGGGLLLMLMLIGVGISLLVRPEPEVPAQSPEMISAAEFEESRWKRLADMPTARAGLAAVAFENHIYAITGEGVAGPVDANERYDPQTDTWETLTPKPIPVQDVHAGVIGGRIYIPGGQMVDGRMTAALEVYDPGSDSWYLGPDLPLALSGYAMETFEGKIFIFGGWEGEEVLDTVFIFDPDMGEWEIGPAMPTARAYAGAAEVGGKIYVIGGWDGDQVSGVNEVFLPNQDLIGKTAWSTEHSSISRPISNHTVANKESEILIFSGKKHKNEIVKYPIFKYSTITNTWESIPDNLGYAFRSQSVVIWNRIFLMGGDGNAIETSVWSYISSFSVNFPILK